MMPETRAAIEVALPRCESVRRGLDPAESERLLAEADRLGVFPAVARNLLGEDNPRIREITARNLWLKQEQGKLLELFGSAGIRARAIKGVDLAERLYPDLSWRDVTDIDLLVDKSDVSRAFDALRSAGLVSNHDWRPSGLARQVARPALLGPELIFSTPSGLTVELHWDWPAGALPVGDLIEEPERYLVYLCRHAGKHFWAPLKWICDIELYLRRHRETLDWPFFWRLSREHEVELSCVVSLELCRGFFDTTAPPGLEPRLGRRARRVVGDATAELLNPSVPRSHPVWRQLRLYPWWRRPGLLRAWTLPQPQEWNRAERRGWSASRLWLERARHLWRAWAPHRLRRLSAADWALLIEAYATVAFFEAARRACSFQRLARMAERGRSGGAPASWPLEKLRRVAWLVEAAANRQPVTIRCLTRSLALARILHRRGVDVELRLGVRQGDDALQAHAWVEWRGEVLNDAAGGAEFTALAGGPL